MAELGAMQVVACLLGAAKPETLGCPVLASFVVAVQRQKLAPQSVVQPQEVLDWLLAIEAQVWNSHIVRDALARWGVRAGESLLSPVIPSHKC